MTEGKDVTPYLVQQATASSHSVDGPTLEYDHWRQVSIVVGDTTRTPAVLRTDIIALTTKKADHEKGEDQKDKWKPSLGR